MKIKWKMIGWLWLITSLLLMAVGVFSFQFFILNGIATFFAVVIWQWFFAYLERRD